MCFPYLARQFSRSFGGIVSILVYGQASFLAHELREVEGKSVGVVESPGEISWKDFGARGQLGDGAVKQPFAAGERLQELLLLLVDDVFNGLDCWMKRLLTNTQGSIY